MDSKDSSFRRPEETVLVNVGIIDRWIRAILGALLLALMFAGAIGAVWGWIALGPLYTGVLGYCPLYHVLGWSIHQS